MPTKSSMLAEDTETTGVDLFHGCKPFFFSAFDGKDTYHWEWEVDPLTREVQYVDEDWEEIAELHNGKQVVFQNARFDNRAILVGDAAGVVEWDWDLIDDTIIASHLLDSNKPRDLTSQALRYIKVDISRYELLVKEAVTKARAIAKKKYPDWKIASDKLPELPSSKKSGSKKKGNEIWKNDMWLPAAIARHEGYPDDHPWFFVLSNYANADTGCTLPIFVVQSRLLQERGLWDLYQFRRRLLSVITDMEDTGVTYSVRRLDELKSDYVTKSMESEKRCLEIAGENLTKLPKGGSSNELKNLLFNVFNLPVVARSKKTKAPSANKVAIEAWLAMLDAKEPAHEFLTHLSGKRSRDTAVNFMTDYNRFSFPVNRRGLKEPFRRLFPNFNPTGSDTLRFASYNPNGQNISKKKNFNLRYLFGPLPGREWWSLDYENIELRIPAYEAGEVDMIELFERPMDPPYYGSNHLLVAHILLPEMFDECIRNGESFKNKYGSTWYQWIKNGNFATQYGAMEESGTADRAYHIKGAQARIKKRFGNITALGDEMIAHAQEYGFVYTMPDNEFGIGYPLQCPVGFSGSVKPTVPLNYHVQGTAMWCMTRAMVRCYNYLRDEWGPLYRVIMQIHDELVFEMPYKPDHGNLPIVMDLMSLMEESGKDINIPLKVSGSYIRDNWANAEEIDLDEHRIAI